MRLIFDLDGTICENKKNGQHYKDVEPLPGAVESLQKLKNDGHYIIIQTARHMVTYGANEGKILANLEYLYEWLKKWNIPYDELYIGKPHGELFIDDKAIHHINWSITNILINKKVEELKNGY